jgi:hypothetical protein
MTWGEQTVRELAIICEQHQTYRVTIQSTAGKQSPFVVWRGEELGHTREAPVLSRAYVSLGLVEKKVIKLRIADRRAVQSDAVVFFVDVPITTFSPVKVVQDLLREQHQ